MATFGGVNPGISKDIHMLRNIIKALAAKIENDEGEDERAVDDEIRNSLFPTDLVRLMNAKLSLTRCLVCRAKAVYGRNMPPMHGNLRPDIEIHFAHGISPNIPHWDEFETQPDMDDPVVQPVIVADAHLTEAMMEHLCDFKRLDYIGACKKQFPDGSAEEEAEARPKGQEPLPRKCLSLPYKLTLDRLDIAKHLVLSNAGFMGHANDITMLDSSFGLSSELMVSHSIKFARRGLEANMSLLFQEGPLSTDIFFTRTQKSRHLGYTLLISLARYLGVTYKHSIDMEMPECTADLHANESDDGHHFVRLGLFLAIKIFGTGHPYTKNLAREANYDGIDDYDRLQEDLNSWLSNSYRSLYNAF